MYTLSCIKPAYTSILDWANTGGTEYSSLGSMLPAVSVTTNPICADPSPKTGSEGLVNTRAMHNDERL